MWEEITFGLEADTFPYLKMREWEDTGIRGESSTTNSINKGLVVVHIHTAQKIP